MIENIINDFTGKKIIILGFGLEGKSSYSFIRRHSDMILTIGDKNEIRTNNEYLLDDRNLMFKIGENYLDNLEDFDIIIKSPGIYLNDEKINHKITSQLNILLKYNKDNVVGVTGTKGKSTTSSLIYEGLKSSNKEVLLLGNIGNPIFDELENINKETILVVECSAFQLQYVKYSPRISIIINLLEDHLDYFKNVFDYHKAKLNIFKNQTKNDISIYLKDCVNITNYLNEDYFGNKKILEFCGDYGILDNEKIDIPDLKIVGEKNKENALIAIAVCKLLNVDIDRVKDGISNFTGLEHRMEYVGVYGDIIFYNDTIATIPEATISAVKSLKKVDTLIIGGMDRGINYSELIEFLNKDKVNNLVCMPTTGHKLADKLDKDIKMKIYKVENLEEAVIVSKNVTEKNKICLLSPAASSYEHYKNFEEKGKHFKNLIKGFNN